MATEKKKPISELSDEELYAQAMAEREIEKERAKGKYIPEATTDNTQGSEGSEPKETPAEETDDEVADTETRKETPKKAPDDTLEPEEDGEKEAEEKPDQTEEEAEAEEGEAKPQPKQKEGATAISEEELNKLIDDYAEAEVLTREDAEKDVRTILGIKEKYKGNADELSKAYLNLQRLVAQKDQQLQQLSLPKDGFYEDFAVIEGKKFPRVSVIEGTKKEYPKKTEAMSDDEVYEHAKMIYETSIKSLIEMKRKEMPRLAKEKRLQYINAVPEKDKRFREEVEKLINVMDDAVVLHQSFNPTNILYWAKGRKYDKDVREAEERGFKRGREEAKIIGEKGKKVSSSAPAEKKEPASDLTAAEKKRALEMFEDDDISIERKFKLYKEAMKK